jgi:hypothetical protein
MASPCWFGVVDALVTGLRAETGYSAPGGTGIPVFDGPTPTGDVPQQYIVVGSRGDDTTAGSIETDWHAFGARADRDETGEVYLYAAAWSGDVDSGSTLRGQVRAMCESATTVGYSLSSASWQAYRGLTAVDQIDQRQTGDGLLVEARMVLRYMVRRD